MKPHDDDIAAEIREKEREKETKFKVQPRALEAKPDLRFDKIAKLLDEVEGPDHR